SRRFQTQQLGNVLRWAVPALKFFERFVRPRWHTPFEATKHAVGAIVLVLSVLLLAPVPLSNVPPALVIMLLSCAYLEEDGMLLCIALLAALLLLASYVVAVWQAMSAAGWVKGLL